MKAYILIFTGVFAAAAAFAQDAAEGECEPPDEVQWSEDDSCPVHEAGAETIMTAVGTLPSSQEPMFSRIEGALLALVGDVSEAHELKSIDRVAADVARGGLVSGTVDALEATSDGLTLTLTVDPTNGLSQPNLESLVVVLGDRRGLAVGDYAVAEIAFLDDGTPTLLADPMRVIEDTWFIPGIQGVSWSAFLNLAGGER